MTVMTRSYLKMLVLDVLIYWPRLQFRLLYYWEYFVSKVCDYCCCWCLKAVYMSNQCCQCKCVLEAIPDDMTGSQSCVGVSVGEKVSWSNGARESGQYRRLGLIYCQNGYVRQIDVLDHHYYQGRRYVWNTFTLLVSKLLLIFSISDYQGPPNT